MVPVGAWPASSEVGSGLVEGTRGLRVAGGSSGTSAPPPAPYAGVRVPQEQAGLAPSSPAPAPTRRETHVRGARTHGYRALLTATRRPSARPPARFRPQRNRSKGIV